MAPGSVDPVSIYYVNCQEEGCWVIFDTERPPRPICPVHGHELNIRNIKHGTVVEYECSYAALGRGSLSQDADLRVGASEWPLPVP